MCVFIDTESVKLCELHPSLSLSLSLSFSLRCEQALMSGVTERTCLKLYQVSEEHNAEALKGYCLKIISNHWVSYIL